MAHLNEKAFLSNIRQSVSDSLFVFYGQDEYSKEICVKKLLNIICKDSKPTVFDGQALDLVNFHEECCSVSFFSEEKCIYLRNPAIESFNADQAETFYKILTEKPSSTFLVIVIKSQEVNVKTSSKWAKFIKIAEQNGSVVECAEKTQNDAVSMIMSVAKKNGCQINRELAYSLSERCLNDMLLIESNMLKLCAYALQKYGGIITEDALEHLTAKTLDFKTYEIMRQILNNKPQNALKILDSLFLQQVDAIAISSALASSFLDIYRVKLMQEYNHSTSEFSETFEYKNAEKKFRAIGYDAQKCSMEFIKNALLILSQTDILLKSTKDNKKIVLEKALMKIILNIK